MELVANKEQNHATVDHHVKNEILMCVLSLSLNLLNLLSHSTIKWNRHCYCNYLVSCRNVTATNKAKKNTL